MTALILSAKPCVETVKVDLKKRCDSLKARGCTPAMSVVLVGDNPASLSYIKNKKKLCEEVGAKFTLHQLSPGISSEDFLKTVQGLNNDPATHGIIIQLPVTDQLAVLDLPQLVIPSKDIDGFHGENTRKLFEGSTDMKLLLPCTPKGVVNLLKYYGHDVAGKHVVILGRSLIVGKPLSLLLTNLNATVTLAHSKTKNLEQFTKTADIVVAAIGRGHFLDRTYFDPNRNTVVIDVGMNSLNGKLVGDVHTEDVKDVVRAISPVPGGVGPMTVLSLIENLITATEKQLKG
ncbi:MAG: bifunctional 5,10-methylenetetrahydrofolate dehydrogenase/5,10-methenyltetrahydrofolate cyclohydrolase [Bacteriovoracaceae bacterium]